MNYPLHQSDDLTTHPRASAVVWMKGERFILPEVPPLTVSRGRDRNPRSSRFAAIGLAFSLLTHLGLSAWLSWHSDPSHEAISFAGQTQAIQIEATFVEPTPESPPEPVEMKVEPPARSAPASQNVELARQVTESVEMVPTDTVAERKVAPAATTVELARREVSTGDSPEDPATEPRPRAARPRQVPPSIAAVPIPPGTQTETPPDFTHNPPPRYPAEALARGWHGEVELRLTISATGRVEEVRVLKSSGYPVLDQAAVEAVSQWRGVAAKRGGRPVASVEVLPVRFRRGS